MSDTHRAAPRYTVESVNAGCDWEESVKYIVVDTDTDGIFSRHFTRTAALAICSRLNGYDMTPEQDRKENR
jgi:hypothetical protein